MPFVMPRPIKDPKSGVFLFNQRLPVDLKHLKGQSITVPVGDAVTSVRIGEVLRFSLRTKDRKEAADRYAEAMSHVRHHWQAHRRGPQPLSFKDATALAGRLYLKTTELLESNPGEPDVWLELERHNALVRSGEFGAARLIIGNMKDKVGAAREARYGGIADALLARKGVVTDAAGRQNLLKAVQQAMEDAVGTLKRRADGDYSPDLVANRFPEWVEPRGPDEQAQHAKPLTISGLFDAWALAREKQVTPATIRRYRPSFRSLASFLADKDAADVTDEDVFAWAEHRRDSEGINPRTINRNDLVAVSAVYEWAKGIEGKRQVKLNPAAGLRLRDNIAEPTREPTFRAEEIQAILQAASAQRTDDPEDAAKRWCPWIMAYSGARVTEVTGLTGNDVRMEDGITVLDLRFTKTHEPRTVPLHDHLVEQGFIAYARSRGSKPLFYEPGKPRKGRTTTPAQECSKMLAEWVREEVLLEADVQPNHAWRHTWKTRAMEAGIEERLSDVITGHKVKSVARSYEHNSVRFKKSIIDRFPRYEV